MDQAYRRNVGRVRIPGFRPGKAPRRIFERHVGREALLQEALDKSLAPLPGLYDHLLGMSKGDHIEFDAEVPEDYRRADLAGKTIHYDLTVLDVKQEVLPELNDDFAREVGEGFESLEALRTR